MLILTPLHPTKKEAQHLKMQRTQNPKSSNNKIWGDLGRSQEKLRKRRPKRMGKTLWASWLHATKFILGQSRPEHKTRLCENIKSLICFTEALSMNLSVVWKTEPWRRCNTASRSTERKKTLFRRPISGLSKRVKLTRKFSSSCKVWKRGTDIPWVRSHLQKWRDCHWLTRRSLVWWSRVSLLN